MERMDIKTHKCWHRPPGPCCPLPWIPTHSLGAVSHSLLGHLPCPQLHHPNYSRPVKELLESSMISALQQDECRGEAQWRFPQPVQGTSTSVPASSQGILQYLSRATPALMDWGQTQSHMAMSEERDMGRPFSDHLATKGVLEELWSWLCVLGTLSVLATTLSVLETLQGRLWPCSSIAQRKHGLT